MALRTLLWEFSKPYITVTVNRVSSTANGHKNMCNYISLKRTGTFLLMAHLGSPEKKAIKRVCVHVHWYFYAKFNFSAGGVSLWYLNYYYYYYYTCLTHLFPEHPGWAGTRKEKTDPDFTEARDSEWQWHQLGHMQVCISLQTDNHISIPPLSFLQAGCPSCHPTNSVRAQKANMQ